MTDEQDPIIRYQKEMDQHFDAALADVAIKVPLIVESVGRQIGIECRMIKDAEKLLSEVRYVGSISMTLFKD